MESIRDELRKQVGQPVTRGEIFQRCSILVFDKHRQAQGAI